jgi:16S rRNA (guanine966-N2)-methyltransferase
MRIVAGEWGGRQLVAPKGRGVRPTLERVREAIFDVLQARVPKSKVLDLFAGSGAFGLEAMSRGARHVVWCDVEQRSIDAVRDNGRRLGARMPPNTVLCMDATDAIARLKAAGETFDIVFVDPPWESGFYDETLLALALSGIVAPGAVVVVEHARRFDVSPVFGHLVRDRVRQYGDTCVSYFRRPEEAP